MGWPALSGKRLPIWENVTDATWKAAQQAGWSDEQLADAFAYLGATVFTGYFLNYAQTDLDL
jgi:hypothetical protein